MPVTFTRRTRDDINSGGFQLDPGTIDPRRTALLLIDLQYLDAHPDHGLGVDARRRGVFERDFAYYFSEVKAIVPRLRATLELCRETGVQVVHVRIGALTGDGRDVSAGHKRLKLFAFPGSREIDILDELAPIGGEVVLSKGASGVFNATAIDQILRNMGIDTLIVGGVVTNYCVETAVRDAGDRGYSVFLLSDGCAAMTEEQQLFALSILDGVYCTVCSSAEIGDVLKRFGVMASR
jgi:nicotinamidase-related amidase